MADKIVKKKKPLNKLPKKPVISNDETVVILEKSWLDKIKDKINNWLDQ